MVSSLSEVQHLLRGENWVLGNELHFDKTVAFLGKSYALSERKQ